SSSSAASSRGSGRAPAASFPAWSCTDSSTPSRWSPPSPSRTSLRNVRRILVAGAAALAFAPAAHAGCGITTTKLTGKAPLAVTLTAQCASASYAWALGDGTTATGQTVQHVYAAGSWRPTLTSDAGADKVGPVTSVSLTVSLPRRVRYAQYVALRAT